MNNKILIPGGMTYMADNVKRKDNILGVPKKEGADWAKNLNLPKNGETIFFAGCGYQYEDKLENLMGLIRKMDKSVIGTERAMGLANLQKKMGLDGIFLKALSRGRTTAGPLVDAVRVLQKLGIEFSYLAEEEPCCGAIIYFMGEKKQFAEHSRKVYEKLKAKGIKEIIGIVPSCTYALKTLNAENNPGYDIKVKHFCEIVSENLNSLKLKFPDNVKVAYHDPCQLSRYLKLIDEPRAILRAIEGIELVETKETYGKMSTCCGGGGGFEAVFPEMSEMLVVNRARELVETGADIIITHCPGCVMQLKTGVKLLKPEKKVEVLDLAQVVAMSMEVS